MAYFGHAHWKKGDKFSRESDFWLSLFCDWVEFTGQGCQVVFDVIGQIDRQNRRNWSKKGQIAKWREFYRTFAKNGK